MRGARPTGQRRRVLRSKNDPGYSSAACRPTFAAAHDPALSHTAMLVNGEFLFCDQQGYLDCFKVSRGQCLQELLPLKENCLERANQKFPDRLVDEKDIDRYASYFSVCMMLQHSADKNANELGSCLKNVEWDRAQRDKSLLK